MSARLDRGHARCSVHSVLGLAGMASLVLVCVGPVWAQSKLTSPPVRREIAVGAQSVLSSTLGKADQGYRAKSSALGYATENPANHLSAHYDPDGVKIRFQNANLALEFQGWGYGKNLVNENEVTGALSAKDNRVEYRRGVLTEWYINGPLGIEQGFTISQPPVTPTGSRNDALNIALHLRGNLNPSIESGGHAIALRDESGMQTLRYGPLLAYDASGRELESWIEERDGNLQLRVNTSGARYPVVVDPFVQVPQQLSVTSVSDAPEYFGISTAVSDDGTVIVAGACGYDTSAGGCPVAGDTSATPYQGHAYVFLERVSGWATVTSPTADLTAPDGAIGDGFGSAVAISGDGMTIAVSAPQISCSPPIAGAFCGEAYVFTAKSETAWATTNTAAILAPSDSSSGDYFGYALAIDAAGYTVAVRQLPLTGETPIAHVNLYLKPAAGWNLTTPAPENAQLQSSDVQSGDNFGNALAISQDSTTVVAGASAVTLTVGGESVLFTGEAYVFLEPPVPTGKAPGYGWNNLSGPPAAPTMETVKLQNSDTVPYTVQGSSILYGGQFGWAVAVDKAGDTITATAPAQRQAAGEAYVFVVPDVGWATKGPLNETTRFIPPASLGSVAMGGATSISDDGQTASVSGGTGAYLFTAPTGWSSGTFNWTSTNPLVLAPALTNGAYIGVMPTNVSGNTLANGNQGTVVIGEPGNNFNSQAAIPYAIGAVFVYSAQSSTCTTITISPSTLEPVAAGTLFTQTFSSTDTATPLSWSISPGLNWLTMTSAGELSGTPPAQGTYNFTVSVSDANKCTASASFTLTVNPAPVQTTTTLSVATASFSGNPLTTDTALVNTTPVTVSFTVVPKSGSVAASGSVTVSDNLTPPDTCTATLTVSSTTGSGSCQIKFAQVGSAPLTANYTPDAAATSAGLASSSSSPPVVETVGQSAECGPLPAPGSIPAGSSGTVTFTVCVASDENSAPTAGTANCPPNATCTPTVTPVPGEPGVYTVVLTITTTASVVPMPGSKPGGRPWPPLLLALASLVFLWMLYLLARHGGVRQRPRLSYAAGLVLALALLLGSMNGCLNSSTPNSGNNHGTPPNTYVVNITITEGNFTFVVPVTIIVT